jgi:hypothetical protein
MNGKGRIYDHAEIVIVAPSGFDGECCHYGEYGHLASDYNNESIRHFKKKHGGIGGTTSRPTLRTTSSQ